MHFNSVIRSSKQGWLLTANTVSFANSGWTTYRNAPKLFLRSLIPDLGNQLVSLYDCKDRCTESPGTGLKRGHTDAARPTAASAARRSAPVSTPYARSHTVTESDCNAYESQAEYTVSCLLTGPQPHPQLATQRLHLTPNRPCIQLLISITGGHKSLPNKRVTVTHASWRCTCVPYRVDQARLPSVPATP